MQSFNHIERVYGELSLTGDKSISHRALILSSFNKNKSKLINLSDGTDVKSTISCLTQMGTEINKDSYGSYLVQAKDLLQPTGIINLYAGNSGSTARLLCGILIHKDYGSTLSGDSSLLKRPMKRVIDPLILMGGNIQASAEGTLPVQIKPSQILSPINYKMMIPSAQVKSAIILSGLFMEGITSIKEKDVTRDHTERMLGLKFTIENNIKTIFVSNKNLPDAGEYIIPGDISSAAFYIVLALLTKGSELRLKNLSMNPTRTAFIEILKQMGGNIEFANISESFNEPFGDITIKSSRLNNVDIPDEIIPQIIDEIPILAVAGLLSEGTFTIRNAKELRVKECDRINALCRNFRLMNLSVEEFEDGFSVSGNPDNKVYEFESFNDHRIAMSFGILSLLLCNGGKVNNFDSVGISNPEFLNQLKYISK